MSDFNLLSTFVLYISDLFLISFYKNHYIFCNIIVDKYILKYNNFNIDISQNICSPKIRALHHLFPTFNMLTESKMVFRHTKHGRNN